MMPVMYMSGIEMQSLSQKVQDNFYRSCHGLFKPSHSMTETAIEFSCELLGYDLDECDESERKMRMMTVSLWLKGMVGSKKKSRGQS